MKILVLFVLFVIGVNLIFGIANLFEGSINAGIVSLVTSLACALVCNKEIRKYFLS